MSPSVDLLADLALDLPDRSRDVSLDVGQADLLVGWAGAGRCRGAPHGVGTALVILAIDQGTTGHHLHRLRRGGAPGGRAYREFSQHFPRPGWVEHDAQRDLGRHPRGGARGARRGGRERRDARRHRHHQPARDRRGLGPRHRRAAAPRDRLAGPAHGRAAATSCARPGTSRSSASAPGWCSTPTSPARRSSGCSARAACRRDGAPFGTIDSWLVFKLTGGHVTDYSNASRTLLFDIRELALGPRAVRAARRGPAARCPSRAPSAHVLRRDDRVRRLGARWPGIAGDQQAALYGQACHEPGLGKNTYGTGSFVLQNAGAELPAAGGRPAHHRRLGRGGPRGLRARGRDLRDRRRGAVAARRARGHPDRRRDRGAGALARLERRRVPRARLHRARLAALGPVRARARSSGLTRGAGPRAPRARRARGDGLPDGRRRAGDGGGLRRARSRS